MLCKEETDEGNDGQGIFIICEGGILCLGWCSENGTNLSYEFQKSSE